VTCYARILTCYDTKSHLLCSFFSPVPHDGSESTPIGDHEVAFVKPLYLVYLGVEYECQTSDGGRTYHAYPYHGEMVASLYKRLSVLEGATTHGPVFADWVDKHIRILGSVK